MLNRNQFNWFEFQQLFCFSIEYYGGDSIKIKAINWRQFGTVKVNFEANDHERDLLILDTKRF